MDEVNVISTPKSCQFLVFFWQHNITYRIWQRDRNETQLRFAFLPSKRLTRFSKPIWRKVFLVIQIPSDSKNPYHLPHLQGYIAQINRYYSHRLASFSTLWSSFRSVLQVVWCSGSVVICEELLIQTREELNQDHILYCFRWNEIKFFLTR